MRRDRALLFILSLLALVLAIGPRTIDAEEPPYPDYSAPVYFIISFDDTFVVRHPKESETIMVHVGTLLGGGDIQDTRFVVNESLTGLTLPDGRKDPKFEDLQDNAATVLGSFYALDEQGFHTVVPTPGEVDPEIQEAVFQASNLGALDNLLVDEPFPTTEDIAEVIAAYLPDGSPFTEEDIYDHVFGSAIELSLTAGSAEGEGELFPHEPNSDSLFSFVFSFDEDAVFTQDVRLEVPVDMQSPVNVSSKKGVLPVTIESSDNFDASEVDVSSLRIGNVGIAKGSQATLNGDGSLVVKFSVPALVKDKVLTSSTTELTVHGEIVEEDEDGEEIRYLFQGTDEITVTSSSD